MEDTLKKSSPLVRITRTALQVMRATISNIAEASTRYRKRPFYAKPVTDFRYNQKTTSNSSHGLPKLPLLSPLDSKVGPCIRRKMFAYYTPSLVERGEYFVTIEEHRVYKLPQEVSTTEMESSQDDIFTTTNHTSVLEDESNEEVKAVDLRDVYSPENESKLETFSGLMPSNLQIPLERVSTDSEQKNMCSDQESILESFPEPSSTVPPTHQSALEDVGARLGCKAVEENDACYQESTLASIREPNTPLSSHQSSYLVASTSEEVSPHHTSHYEGSVSVGDSNKNPQVPTIGIQSSSMLTHQPSFPEGVACSKGFTTTGQDEVNMPLQDVPTSKLDTEQEQTSSSAQGAQGVDITHFPKRRQRPRRSVLNTDRKMYMTSKSSELHQPPDSEMEPNESKPEPAEQLPTELIIKVFGYDVAKYPFWMVDTKFPLPSDIRDVELPFINRRLINFHKNDEEEFRIFATGSSELYHASKDGTDVLVKDYTHSSKTPEQILDECRIISLLAGTSITPRLHGVVQQGFGDDYFMVMDECKGFISLTQLLSSGLYIPKSSWIKICINLASHTKNLHHHKILHNNINTDNILVHKDTLEVKLVGFGSASFNKGVKLQPAVLETRVISPEVKLGCFSSTESDVYALGSVLEKVMTESRALDLHQVVEKTHQDLPRDRPSAEEVHSMVLDIYTTLC